MVCLVFVIIYMSMYLWFIMCLLLYTCPCIYDFLQVFVETLDKCFENVCELDLIFHVDKVRNDVNDSHINSDHNLDRLRCQYNTQ